MAAPDKPQPLSMTKIHVCISLAMAVTAWALWYGDVVGVFGDLPKLANTIIGSLTGADQDELKPYKCLSADSSEDFKLLMEQFNQAGAYVDSVGLGTFDGIRGLRALRHIPKGEPILAIPSGFALSVATIPFSTQAGQATTNWRLIPDADMHLDTLALLYEAHVRGARSAWKHYFCTFPQQYDLPLLYRDAWSQQALAALPEMNRLVNKRRAELAYLELATKAALQQMPGGDKLLKNVSRTEFSQLHTKSYSAAKTRTLTWDLEEARENKFKLILPASLSWLEEVGFLVPILDMANHASKATATAVFTIDYTGSHTRKGLGGTASLSDERPARANRNSKASKGKNPPTLSLVAQKDINPGDQITFSYLPEDDITPQCNDRWLLEYGMVQRDGHPMRDCYGFNVTAADLARVAQSSSAAAGDALEEQAVQQALKVARAASWLTVRLVRSGVPQQPLLDDNESMGVDLLLRWAKAALGGDGTRARAAACALLQEQAAHLEQQVARIKELEAAMKAEAGEQGGDAVVGTGGAEARRLGLPSPSRRADLLTVLDGALRAVHDGPRHLGCA